MGGGGHRHLFHTWVTLTSKTSVWGVPKYTTLFLALTIWFIIFQGVQSLF